MTPSTTSLTTEKIWPLITKLCRSGRGYVAVAYLGTAGRALLPLQRGSVLVVDASEGSVQAGRTCPRSLAAFVKAGVDVHTAQDLHAKVFAFPKHVIVGSTNASSRSAKYLQEAVVTCSEPRLVRQAREFVLDLAGDPLTVARLSQLQKLWRPPARMPGRSARARASVPDRSPVWVAPVSAGNWSGEARRAAAKARKAAKSRRMAGEELKEYDWKGSGLERVRTGHAMVPLLVRRGHTSVLVIGTIVALERYDEGSGAITFVSVPKGRKNISIERARERLGPYRAVLSTSDNDDPQLVKDPATIHALRQLWRPR